MGTKTLLSGYIPNRTKEAVLASIMLALFFVARTYKIQVIPGLFLFDFSFIFMYTSASLFSWPYTLLFSMSSVYLASIPLLGGFCNFLGIQAVYFISRKVGLSYGLVLGHLTGLSSYGVALHLLGLMDFRVYLLACGVPALICVLSTYVGGRVIWSVLRRLGAVE